MHHAPHLPAPAAPRARLMRANESAPSAVVRGTAQGRIYARVRGAIRLRTGLGCVFQPAMRFPAAASGPWDLKRRALRCRGILRYTIASNMFEQEFEHIRTYSCGASMQRVLRCPNIRVGPFCFADAGICLAVLLAAALLAAHLVMAGIDLRAALHAAAMAARTWLLERIKWLHALSNSRSMHMAPAQAPRPAAAMTDRCIVSHRNPLFDYVRLFSNMSEYVQLCVSHRQPLGGR